MRKLWLLAALVAVPLVAWGLSLNGGCPAPCWRA